jgi:hypothetical protein
VPTFGVHVRSALWRAVGDAVRLAFTIRVGLLFSVVAAALSYLASHNWAAAVFSLLSFPVVLALAFLWFVAHNLVGWSSQWIGSYERHAFEIGDQASAPKHLSLWVKQGSVSGLFPNGVRCVVREPGGLVSTCTREHIYNGFSFPAEFPELVPPAPGRHRALWLMRGDSDRWWILAQLDFDVPPMLVWS